MKACSRSVLALVLALTLGIGAAQAQQPRCEPEKLAQKYPQLAGKTLKIGVDPQSPPYSMRDAKDFDKIIGVDADLARAVLDCAGAKYTFFIGGWSGLMPALLAGQIDVFWNNLYYTPERGKQANYVMYMNASTGTLTQPGNPSKLTGMGDLCGKTVAYGLGAVEEAMIKKQNDACKAAGKPAVTTMTYPDLASGMRLIESKRADVMLHDQALVRGIAKSNPAAFGNAFKELNGFNIGVAVRKKDSDLLKAIDDGLRVIQASGKQNEIFVKYGVDTDLQLKAEIRQ
jgi:polar amino acid transport system substrate-binding protein